MDTYMIKEVLLRTDGGVRNGKTACAYVVFDPKNEKNIIFSGSKTCGKGTSNTSEYRGLITGLIHCLKEKIKIVHIILDSQVVVRQINGSFKVTNKELKKHKDKVIELLEKFDNYSIKWEPRENNKKADKLVNEAFDVKINKRNK